jgi:outer membrane protein assembly factor BamB
MKTKIILSLAFTWICTYSFTQDVTQFRGANRDGVFQETNLLKEWPEEGPELVWSTDSLGKGYSSPVIGNNKIYVTGLKDTIDYLSALDLDGNPLWTIECGRAWNRSFPDTRSTPTLDGDRVYAISGLGIILCANATTGETIWTRNGFEDFEAQAGDWGVAESPLIVDDVVIYTPCGFNAGMVALNKFTGETVWESEPIKDTTAYVSPILVNYAGKKMIVNVASKNIVGVDAANGDIMWTYYYYDLHTPLWHPRAPIINCNMAYFEDGQIYFTSGYNHVGGKLQLNEDGTGVELLWSDSTLDVHHGHYVKLDNFIYGSNWISNKEGDWCCINWETGETMYVEPWNTKGAIIYADKHLYCLDEHRGNLALVEPSPEKFNIKSSFRITQGKGPYWAHPVIENGVLYVRHGEVLMAYDVKEK